MNGWHKSLWACTLLLWPACVAASAGPCELPPWDVLEFEQRGFGVTARSRLELAEDSADGCALALTADSSIANNAETLAMCMEPASYRLLQRSRLSKGRDQRYKSWSYAAGHILRERREPGRDAARPPEEWQLSSRREVRYPDAAADLPVIDAYALLPLAGRFLAEDTDSIEVIVHTDLNFYRVRMTRGGNAAVPADYRLLEEEATVSGRRDAQVVIVRATPVGKPEDKPDFSLLGLSGEITVLLDAETGVPLQLRGRAPRIGAATINLTAVRMKAAAE